MNNDEKIYEDPQEASDEEIWLAEQDELANEHFKDYETTELNALLNN